jgi:hypothetical protein
MFGALRHQANDDRSGAGVAVTIVHQPVCERASIRVRTNAAEPAVIIHAS